MSSITQLRVTNVLQSHSSLNDSEIQLKMTSLRRSILQSREDESARGLAISTNRHPFSDNDRVIVIHDDSQVFITWLVASFTLVESPPGLMSIRAGEASLPQFQAINERARRSCRACTEQLQAEDSRGNNEYTGKS